MDESPGEREALLIQEYHNQTARIGWHDLQTSYARGTVVQVASTLNLVDVAVQLGMDNTSAFQGWIDTGDVAAVTDEQAKAWYSANVEFWAVVAAPWVLVQLVEESTATE
ncbi:MAG: hypothetical protein ACI9NT_000925 [Bacteroidia bacterium]|jgi:hypothetical protein